MRIVTFILCLAATASPALAGTVYQVDLVNAGASGIVSIESARSGSERFHALRFVSRPSQYASESVSFQLRRGDDACARDLRINFADGRVLTHRRFDPCNAPTDEVLRDGSQVADADTAN